MAQDSSATLAALRRLMDQHFDLDGIRGLSMDLGIDYEHLRG